MQGNGVESYIATLYKAILVPSTLHLVKHAQSNTFSRMQGDVRHDSCRNYPWRNTDMTPSRMAGKHATCVDC